MHTEDLTVAWDDEDFAMLHAEGNHYTEGLRRYWLAKLNHPQSTRQEPHPHTT